MKRRQSREGVKERFVGQIADPPQREGAPELLRQLLDSAASNGRFSAAFGGSASAAL